VLAAMSIITLVASLVAIRIRVDRDEDAPATVADAPPDDARATPEALRARLHPSRSSREQPR